MIAALLAVEDCVTSKRTKPRDQRSSVVLVLPQITQRSKQEVSRDGAGRAA